VPLRLCVFLGVVQIRLGIWHGKLVIFNGFLGGLLLVEYMQEVEALEQRALKEDLERRVLAVEILHRREVGKRQRSSSSLRSYPI
jgi:hypothetical protein